MTILHPPANWTSVQAGSPDLSTAAALVAGLGFLALSDLPDRPGPAWLVVALRATPTLQHYDPEAVEYWVTRGGRGVRRSLSRPTPMPRREAFSWGLIRITDRLHATNEYLTFGGTLHADVIDDAVVCTFVSPAPILRRGGHSQVVDAGADVVGAWFGRLLLAVDVVPGFEWRLSTARPEGRYASFLADLAERYAASPSLREHEPGLWTLLRVEEHRLCRHDPEAWRTGQELRAASQHTVASRGSPPA